MDKMTKRLIEEATKDATRGDYLHSSGYAQVQQGSHIGAAGTQTFKQRQKLAREFVGQYSDAQLNRDAQNYHAKANAAQPTTPDQAQSPNYGAERWAALQAAKNTQSPNQPPKK